MKFDSVIFDLDGTLWDTTTACVNSWELGVKKFLETSNSEDITNGKQIRYPDSQDLSKVMGMPPYQIMQNLFPTIKEEYYTEIFDICTETENIYLRKHGGVLYDGIEQMLESLSCKIPLFIVSNCGDGYIESFLEAHKTGKHFADWECIGKSGLPKYQNISLIAKRNSLKKPVYVGDTMLDFEAASGAGIPFIHAAYGFGKVDDVPFIDRPVDLISLIVE